MSRIVLFALMCVALTSICNALIVDDDPGVLMRGDANDSGSINLTDVIYLNNYLFAGGPAPPCMDQADADDSGYINVTDPVYLSRWLFNGGSAPPGPNGDTCP